MSSVWDLLSLKYLWGIHVAMSINFTIQGSEVQEKGQSGNENLEIIYLQNGIKTFKVDEFSHGEQVERRDLRSENKY